MKIDPKRIMPLTDEALQRLDISDGDQVVIWWMELSAEDQVSLVIGLLGTIQTAVQMFKGAG